MSSMILLFSFVGLLCSSAQAYDPSSRNCVDSLCLTSFIWCDRDDCFYPDNVYPLTVDDYQGPPAVIQWSPSSPYNITWKNWDSRYPVNIQWSFPNTTSPDGSIPVQWEVNTTVPSPGWYAWTPSIGDFPNVTDINMAEAQGLTSSPLNVLRISQPEATLANPDYDASESIFRNMNRLGLLDSSSQFIVVSSWAIRSAQSQVQRVRNSYNHRIRLGVGIGVGLGVPVLMALTALVTWFCMRSGSRKLDSKQQI